MLPPLFVFLLHSFRSTRLSNFGSLKRIKLALIYTLFNKYFNSKNKKKKRKQNDVKIYMKSMIYYILIFPKTVYFGPSRW